MKNVTQNSGRSIIFSLLLLTCILQTEARAQIVNGGFESWEYEVWSIDPTDWSTGNWQLQTPVVQDSAAYNGDLAARVIAVPYELGEIGLLSQTIAVVNVPTAITFYAKWEKTWTGAVWVEAEFFFDGEAVFSEYWWGEGDTSSWSQQTLYIGELTTLVTEMKLSIIAEVGDDIEGDAWISVDDIQVSTTTDIAELPGPYFEIYPNPSTDFINIKSDVLQPGKYEIRITDAFGKTVLRQKFESTIDIEYLSSGQYVLQIVSEDKSYTKKFTIFK